MTKQSIELPAKFFTLAASFKGSYGGRNKYYVTNNNVWLYFGDTSIQQPTYEETWNACIQLANSAEVRAIMGETFCVLPLYHGTYTYHPNYVVTKPAPVAISPTANFRADIPIAYELCSVDDVFRHGNKSELNQIYDWGIPVAPEDTHLAIIISPEPRDIIANLLNRKVKTPDDASLILVTPNSEPLYFPSFNKSQVSCLSPYKFMDTCQTCLLSIPNQSDCPARLALNDLHSLRGTTQLDFEDAKELWKHNKTTIEGFTFRSPMYTATHAFSEYKRPITEHSDLSADFLQKQRIDAHKYRKERKEKRDKTVALECSACFLPEACKKLSWDKPQSCDGRYPATADAAYRYITAKVKNPYTFLQTMTLLYNSGHCINRFNKRKVHASLDLVGNSQIIFGLNYVYKPPVDTATSREEPDPFVGKHPIKYGEAKELLLKLNGHFQEIPDYLYQILAKHKQEALAVLYETLAIDSVYVRRGWGRTKLHPISVSMRGGLIKPNPKDTLDMHWLLTIHHKHYHGGLWQDTNNISSLDDILLLKNSFNLLKQVRYQATTDRPYLY